MDIETIYSSRLHVLVSPEMKRNLRVLSDARGERMSELVRRALRREVTKLREEL